MYQYTKETCSIYLLAMLIIISIYIHVMIFCFYKKYKVSVAPFNIEKNVVEVFGFVCVTYRTQMNTYQQTLYVVCSFLTHLFFICRVYLYNCECADSLNFAGPESKCIFILA